MRLTRLAARNVAGHSFRSWLIFLCAGLMASLVISATLFMRGADRSLRLALERLGADIIVIPRGEERRFESALLMGIPVHMWMPDTVLDEIAALPGVAAASPQIYLSTLRGALCCSLPELFLIAYDPLTDFTISPWLERNLEGGLALGEAVGGSFVYVPADSDKMLVYGYGLDLRANIEPTGTGLDQSIFFTLETAHEIARLSPELAVKDMDIPPRTVSAVLVKAAPGVDLAQLADEIKASLAVNVTVLLSNQMFQDQRAQLTGMRQSVVGLLALTWALAMGLIALVFAIAVNERRREIGVLRALGASRATVLRSLLLEAWLLALAGGLSGILLASAVLGMFQRTIVGLLGVPFLYPSLPRLIGLGLGALGLALLCVTLAALGPALRISRMDAAIAMRE
jgi:putative ABC transport system permease protein